MKRNIYLSALIILTAGCASNYDINDLAQEEEVTITASFADSKTRTVLSEDGGTSIYWEAGDEIAVFSGAEVSKFTSTLTEPAAVSTFTGTMPTTIGEKYLALYPFSSDAVSDGKSITMTLPHEQTARAGSFAKNLNLSVAKSDSFSFIFYNVCGGLCFKVITEGIKEITLKSNNGESLAGQVKIAFDEGIPVIREIINGTDTIILNAPDNGTFATGVWYYIVTLPTTLSAGFQMTFRTQSTFVTRKYSDSIALKRRVFGRADGIDDGLTWKSMGNIVFKDNTAKAACVAKFDTNKDGEVSYEEASAVTDLTGLFDNYNTITSFDEIQYFDGVTELPNGLFSGCASLTSLTIPSFIEALGSHCFSGCLKLANVDIPRSVSSIGDYCFHSCAELQSIDLPGDLSSIGEYCFNECTSLSKLTISGSVQSLPAYFIRNCTSLKSFKIPDSVKKLLAHSFAYSYIEELTIPNTVTYVGEYSLEHNPSITKVNYAIESKDSSIPKYCFLGCSSLSSVEMSSSVTTLSAGSFCFCTSLENIVIPSSVTRIREFCFSDCSSLSNINIPSSVTYIGYDCFSDCTSLKKIDIPLSVTELKWDCFNGCTSLSSVVIPTSVTLIDDRCFQGCTSLDNVNIPLSVKSIGKNAFENCSSLTNINISSSVTSIGESCFSGCTALNNVNIPSSVTSIGKKCFTGCTSLTDINISASVTKLEELFFSGCTSLSNVKISSSVKVIEAQCFLDCTSLPNIVIPSSVTELGWSCFAGCISLTSINIPSSVIKLPSGCFNECASLTDIKIPSSVTELGSYCFQGCTSLTDVKIPSSVTELGYQCFLGCTSLMTIEIPLSVTELPGYCFYGCTSLASIEIPSSVKKLGSMCFFHCDNLSKMYCRATSVPTVGSYAFDSTKASTEGYLYVPEESVELYANDSGWKVWKNIQKLQ